MGTTRDSEPYYRGYALSQTFTEADAVAAFVARYGQPPAETIDSGTALLVGPIPETVKDGGAP